MKKRSSLVTRFAAAHAALAVIVVAVVTLLFAHLTLLLGVKLHFFLAAIYLLVLVAVVGANHWYQRGQLRPLQALRAGVEAVARGDFKTRVPVMRGDEIGEVADAFNQMTHRVEQMIADRERLLADVSHELRSPLARMKVALELLPEDDKRESIRGDVREMETLISVLLERERLSARAEHLAVAAVDLTALVRRVVAGFADRPPGVVFQDDAGPVVAEVDGELVRLLVQNLVDNAVKFSRPDSRPVEVRLRTDDDGVELLVTDDGPGIPAEDAERIFEPFVKLDPARGHRRGYGLGLNLCWRVVEAHRGSIEVLPNAGGGTVVRVVLPGNPSRC